MGAQDQHDGPRVCAAQDVHEVRAEAVGEVQVDHRDVHRRAGVVEEVARLGEGAGLGDDGEVGLPPQHKGQRLAEGDVVVHQHHPDLGGQRATSRWKPKTEPPPGAGRTVSSEPWPPTMRRLR